MKKNKPREWYINGPRWIWQKTDWCNENQLDVDEQIRVIEYSAYEELKNLTEEVRSLRTELEAEKARHPLYVEVANNHDKLKFELSEATEAFHDIEQDLVEVNRQHLLKNKDLNLNLTIAVEVLEKMQVGYAGMFGSDKVDPEEDAWELCSTWIHEALTKIRGEK